MNLAKRITILVVDDDPDILFATSRIFQSAGYTVYEADSGTSCLDLIRSKAPDLVFLDVVMPDIDGYEICRQIKSDPDMSSTYVILLSGSKTESDHLSEGLEIGADGYLTRPMAKRELLAHTQSIVRIISAEREQARLIRELQHALAEIKRLSGLLPICSNCKMIRNDAGYWEQIDVYVREHSDADFSHGICPTCAQLLYADFMDGDDE